MTAPELPAYVTLDDLVEVAGIDREVLRRHLRRRGVLRRIGNEYDHVDTATLARVEATLHQRLVQRHVQRALGIDVLQQREPRAAK
jgi:hypothetical protein